MSTPGPVPPPPGPVPPPPGGNAPPPSGDAPPPPGGTPPPPGSDGPSPKRRRGVLVAVLAAVVVLLVPGGVFAWRALDGGGPQPHDVLPADAIGYFRLDLDPSAGQKIEAFRFLRKFPVFSSATGIKDDDEDVRERLIDEFAAATGCDIDFQTDVEPWIGNRLGGVMLPPSDDAAEPGFALALQTSGEEAAVTAMDKVLGCGVAGTDTIGRAYLDGYLIITDSQDNAQRYVESARESALSDNEHFSDTMDLLGDPGIASVWVSGTGMFDAFAGSFQSSETFTGAAEMPSLPESRQLVEDFNRDLAMAFRFDDSYAEIASVATGDGYEELDGRMRADVPDSTAVMLGLGGGAEYLRDNWDLLTDTYPSDAEELDALAGQLGLTMPDDLATALGDSLVVTLDGQDLDLSSIEGFDDLSTLPLGLKVATDPDAVRGIWGQLQDAAAQDGVSLDGLPLEITDDGYVLASTEDYASTLLDDGNLSDSDAYTTAVKDAGSADAVVFVNVDVLEDDAASLLADQGLGNDELDSLRALQALGSSTHFRDGHIESTIRITAN